MGFLIGGLLIVFAVIFMIMIVSSLIIICPPNRVAVISGRTRTLSDGRTVGYRILKGGRTLRIPILEKVAWMDLNTIPLEVSVTNAYSKGAIPLNVQGIANVKVSSQEGLLENAAERFLHVPHAQIGQIAKETLEANLRGVLATLSPEEVNEDRLKFSQTLIDEADDDIKTLGLGLDVLKIQNVTDDVLYLESVGRRLTAEVVRDARVAEADRQSEAAQAEASARQLAQIAGVQADKAIRRGAESAAGAHRGARGGGQGQRGGGRRGRRSRQGGRRAGARAAAHRARAAPPRSRCGHPRPGEPRGQAASGPGRGGQDHRGRARPRSTCSGASPSSTRRPATTASASSCSTCCPSSSTRSCPP